MEPIKNILHHRLQAHRIDSVAQAAEICFYASRCIEKYFDAEFMTYVHVQSIQGDVLIIGMTHPAAADSFRAYSTFILRDLQARFGEKRITRLQTKYLTTS